MSNNYFMVLDFNKDIKSFKIMRDTYKDNDNRYKIKINNNDKKIEEGDIVYIGVLNLPDDSSRLFLKTIVAYKEKDELFQLMGNGSDVERIDFYISHHFDYRCLIGNDLALEAHEWMYAPHFGDMKVTVDVEHKGNKL